MLKALASRPLPSLPSVLLSGDEASIQVGIIKTVGRAPGEGLGLPDGHDPVSTREEGLRKCGLVYRHFEGKQPASVNDWVDERGGQPGKHTTKSRW